MKICNIIFEHIISNSVLVFDSNGSMIIKSYLDRSVIECKEFVKNIIDKCFENAYKAVTTMIVEQGLSQKSIDAKEKFISNIKFLRSINKKQADYLIDLTSNY